MRGVILLTIIAAIHPFGSVRSDELINKCTNGGFEELRPNGIPAGWNGFAQQGASFGISRDAHSGNFALMLRSESEAVAGVNRESDALIPLIRGTSRFHYKAISSGSGGKNLQVCIIAMNTETNREVGRKIFTVPAEHVGDGEWHYAEMDFDFRSREGASRVHFAPRINETTSEKAPGEMLIDDVAVTMIGPRLRIDRFGVGKPIVGLSDQIDLRMELTNIGDQPATGVNCQLRLPEGMNIRDRIDDIPDIAPDSSTVLTWRLAADKPVSGVIEAQLDRGETAVTYLTVMNVGEPKVQLRNEVLRLDFHETPHGYGIISIAGQDRNIIAQTSMLGSLAYKSDCNRVERVALFADELKSENQKLTLTRTMKDVDGVTWNFRFTFELSDDQKWVDLICEAEAEEDREVLAFTTPFLYVPRRNPYDAVFPGLEYMEGGEISSSALDIAEPNHIRRVPHPNKITVPVMAISNGSSSGSNSVIAMMWDAKQRWHDKHDRPSALFASPNRFEFQSDYSVMGLFVPSVPEWVDENKTEAKKPYYLGAHETLRIAAQIFLIESRSSQISSIRAIPYWIEKYGLAQPLELPRGSLEKELEFSLTAYMDTLWVPEEQAWHNTLDWDPWGVRVNPIYVHHLWLASKLLRNSPERERYLERAQLGLEKLGRNPGRELAFCVGGIEEMYRGLKGSVEGILRSQREDGSWRFDPDHMNATDEIHHQDYHKLGKKDDVEIGICANKAYALLRFARMTGDRTTLDAGMKALSFMDRFRIPRAAQVWEVPVHTPDVLASAHAIQAYLEAYRITGEQEYLDRAVYWAHTGLPFIYLWHNEDMPSMLYASIPVFGATWLTHSWFGVAVQWNGLDYASALFDLARYDESLPWEQIARGLTVSALYQQETDEKYKGLYPDSYNLLDRTTSAWKLSPALIIRNLFVMMGYPAEPVTTVVERSGGAVRITAAVDVRDIVLSDDQLRFALEYPPEMDGHIMVAGVDEPKPDAVTVNETIVPRAGDLRAVDQGWNYVHQTGMLILKLKNEQGIMRVAIRYPKLKFTPQILPPLKAVNWRASEHGVGNWIASNDIEDMRIENGLLRARSSGSDPYMTFSPLTIDASKYSEIVIRMSVDEGTGAQLFWATSSQPIGEAQSIHFQIQPDGEMHEYVIRISNHRDWRGTIKALRLDPTNAAGANIAIESMIGR